MVSYNKCYMCNTPIRYGITLCNDCRDKRNYHAAIISINKKRLTQLLNKRELTNEWLAKFKTYSNNIIKNGEVVLAFKRY